MKTWHMQRGQIFSLDFLIAMGLAMLAMGMLLNYYETTANAEKEQRLQNEFVSVATNASALMLESSRCTTNFSAKGYKVYGCAEPGGFANMSKPALMVPSIFHCNISWSAEVVNSTNVECNETLPTDSTSIASVERKFLAPISGLTKADYQKCIKGPCNAYDEYTLTVKVWK